MTNKQDSVAVLPNLPESFARVCDDGYWLLRKPGTEKFGANYPRCDGSMAQEVYTATQMHEYAIAALARPHAAQEPSNG